MFQTGHASVDAVRSYKYTGERLLEMISVVLNNADEQVPLAKKMVTGNKRTNYLLQKDWIYVVPHVNFIL